MTQAAGMGVEPLERRTITTSFGDVSVLDTGGDGPVALFVHGVLMNAWFWGGVIERVADRRRCVAVDLLGSGETTGNDPTQDLSFASHVEVLVEVVAGLGVPAVDLVGNDSGGAILQVLAVRHPQLVRSLVLTNCDTNDHVPPEPIVPFVEAVRAGKALEMFEAIRSDTAATHAFLGMGVERPEAVDPDLIERFAEPLVRNERRQRTIERWMNDLTARDLVAADEALPDLPVPGLLVWGTDDVFFPIDHAQRLVGRLPAGSELVEVPGARLFHPLEHPEVLAGHLRSWWSRQHRS